MKKISSSFCSILLAMLCGSADCGCASRIAHQSPPPTNSALGFEPKRVGAKGEGAARMVVDYNNCEVYQAIWCSPEDERLVVLYKVPGNLFGTTFWVYLFDQHLHLVRTGNLHTGATREPYKLFEVTTDSETVPLPYRDRWTLAVGCYDWQKWDASKPQHYSVEQYAREDPVTAETADIIEIEPVEWDDLEPRFSVGAGRLYEAEVATRAAEAAR